jgi:hypothetical protein
MTAPIQEPNLYRHASGLQWGQNQLFRRPAPVGLGFPLTFRAAIQSIADPEADRTHYPSGDGGDNVYFDTWDTTFDTDVYDISDWEFVDPMTGLDSIAGVSLKAPGIYSLTAQIEPDDHWNGATNIAANYDDGRGVYQEHGNLGNPAGSPDPPFLTDDIPIRFDMNRFIWVLDFADANDDEWDTESDFEVVFSQNMDADIIIYNGLPGKDDGFSNPPLPGQDLWIPGGTDGALGTVPYFLLCYWGKPDWDDSWPQSFPPFGT